MDCFLATLRAIPLPCLYLLTSVSLASAQWIPTRGPEGGIIESFARAGKSVFAKAIPTGIFRSDDDGASWKPVGKAISDRSISAIASLGTSLYAATDLGLFRSRDLGSTWVLSQQGITESNSATGLSAIGASLLVLYSTVDRYRSNDSGATWNLVPPDSLPYGAKSVVTLGKWRIASGDGVYRSEAGGAWKALPSGSPPGPVVELIVDGSKLIAGCVYDGIYISKDSGATWQAANNGIASRLTASLYAHGDTLVAGMRHGSSMQQGGIYRSVDGGATWTQPSQGSGNWDGAALIASGANLLAGTGAGVYLSKDAGLTWEESFRGMLVTNSNFLSAIGNRIYDGTWGNEVHQTRDGGESWTRSRSDSPDFEAFDVKPFGDALYAAGSTGIFRSRDSGSVWTHVDIPVADPFFRSLTTIGPYLIAGSLTTGRLFRTRDGVRWDTVRTGPDAVNVYDLLSQGAYVFLATGREGVFRSRDSGDTWERIGRVDSTEFGDRLAAIGNTLFATWNGAIRRAALSDSQWILTAPLPHGNALCLAVYGERIFVGTESGLYQSGNSGKTWSDAGQGLPAGAVQSIAISNSSMYAGIADASVWRRPLSEFPNRIHPWTPAPASGKVRFHSGGFLFLLDTDGNFRRYDLRGVRLKPAVVR